MIKILPAVDADFGPTVPALAAVYDTLCAAFIIVKAGANDGRANQVTEMWLERIAEGIEREICFAIANLEHAPCGDIEDINRLDALIDWANRCGDHEEVARLAASKARRAA